MRFDLESADRFLFLDYLLPGSSYLERLPLVIRPWRVVPPEPPEQATAIRELAAADQTERAVETALREAQRAMRRSESRTAAALVAVALEVLPRTDPRRAVLLGRHGEALLLAGAVDRAARSFAAAARRREGEPTGLENRITQSLCLSSAGRFEPARRIARHAAEKAAPGAQRARARSALARALARDGQLEPATGIVEAALDDGEPGEQSTRLRLERGLLLLRRGAPEARRQLEDARQTEATALPAWCGLLLLRASRGMPGSGDDDMMRLLAELEGSGRLRLQEALLSSLTILACGAGRLDLALLLGERARSVAERLEDGGLALAAGCRLAESLRMAGRPDDAIRVLQKSLGQSPRDADDPLAHVARCLLAGSLIANASHDVEAVRDLLVRASAGLRNASPAWAGLLPAVVELERLSSEGGGEPRDSAWTEFVAGEAASADEVDLRARAHLARAAHDLGRGDAAAAAVAARAAERLVERRRHRLLRCEALALRATALRRGGGAPGTARVEEQASRLLDSIAAGIADQTRREALLRRPPFLGLRRASVPERGDPRLLALYRMIHALNSARDPDGLLESILDMALGAVKAERGLVLLQDPVSGELVVRLGRNLEPGDEADFETFSRSVVRRAAAGEALLVLDATSDERFRDFRSVSHYGIRSLMCVPLRSRGSIIGAVYLDSRRDAALFTRDDLRFLEAFAGHATIALENLRRRAALEKANRRLEAAAQTRVRFGSLVGRSAAMQQVFDLIEKFSGSDLPVLIRGESGTGKELVARAIHERGPRRRRPFLSENCAAIPDTLLESELFGHVKGAFTGAQRDRAGLLEQASGGTLFLDEVGEMSAAMQAKLLRVLEDLQVRRVGSNTTVEVDVRVLAATHRDLDAELLAGRFREDLYYRLQVLVAHLPPLRDRPEDIQPLCEHFLERIARERGSAGPSLSPEVLELFERHPWPGNVRQLENTLQRLSLLAGEGTINLETLESDRELGSALLPAEQRGDTRLTLAASERQRIREALAAAEGNRERAATMLGISRATIYRKIRQYGLS